MTSKKYTYIVDQYDFSLLPKACEDNEIELVKLLLKNGANPNYYDSNGRKPLFYAIKNKNRELIELLLNIGCDINGDIGFRYYQLDYHHGILSPLMCAVFANYLDIIPFLVKKGADINMIMSNGKSILFNACYTGCNIWTIELLLELGADPSIPDREGNRIIHYLSLKNWGYEKVIELIIKYMYNVENRTEKKKHKRQRVR